MEYLLGFYIVGFVLTSLFVVSVFLRRDLVFGRSKLVTFLLCVLTCVVWPIFVGYAIYQKWKYFKVI